MFFLALVFLPIFLVSSCRDEPSTAPPPVGGTVSGIAKDEQGYGVVGALVEAVRTDQTILSRDTTDDYGLFELKNLPDQRSSLLIRVTHPDFKPFVAPFTTVTSGNGTDGAVLSMMHQDSACGRLKLTITDLATHQPIAGAEVRLKRDETLLTTVLSPQDGVVEFNYLIAGNYSIRISKGGYAVVERTAFIQYCDSAIFDIRMTALATRDSCCDGVLKIVPRDSATNAVLIGASVKVTRIGGDSRTKCSTDDGALFLEICEGHYAVRIAKEGYAVREFTVTMGCNEEKLVTSYLSAVISNDSCCHGSIQFTVVDSTTRSPVSGATVKLMRGSTVVAIQTTGGDSHSAGTVLFANRCMGEYSIRVIKEGYAERTFSFYLGCDVQYVHTIAILATTTRDSCCHGSVQFTVVDSTTRDPINDATVKLRRGSTVIAAQMTGGDNRQAGTVRFLEICEGSYNILIVKSGYTAREFEFTIGCNEEYVHTLGLKQVTIDSCHTAVLKLRVKDSTVAEGGWLSGATVTLTMGHTTICTDTTNAEGWFIRSNLTAPATYTATISKQGYRTKSYVFTYKECITLEEIIRLAP
ncbi:MAG: carboxypeptidase regulatory-like domain-containing protein [Bacteroidota bacterium]|nr:carboxypeptidase regulatory-like domain-containing protein [Bacteroidota bacterium]